MITEILSHLGPAGQFMTGLTAVAGIWKVVKNASKRGAIEATSHYMQQMIADQLLRESERHSPYDYHTLDIEFPNGHRMAVPMFHGVKVLVSENIQMAVQDHSTDLTEMGLWCDGYGTFPTHRHSDNCETIYIERGTVTHLESGMIYRAGDVWRVEPGEWHSATFNNCYCRIIHRPPLLSAAVRPINLEAMEKVFPKKKSA
jgi:quercetin dioxygenase-like cupin family protein